MSATDAITIDSLRYRYGDRIAVDDVSFSVRSAEIFALLGPNGCGKTTMFRVLSTLVPAQSGQITVLGWTLPAQVAAIRSAIGVVFQAPSVDRKLTVWENITQQAALYGLSAQVTRERGGKLLEQMALTQRRDERVETLSGGLRRRVELAKAMIHHPRVLLMDEPSTGLDPGARKDLWTHLQHLRDTAQVTVLLTTHLLEEAEKADRIAIMNEGRIVALDRPEALRAEMHGDVITIETLDAATLADRLAAILQLECDVVDGRLRLEASDGQACIRRILDAFPQEVRAIRLSQPTLEDIFIRKTGHQFWQEAPRPENGRPHAALVAGGKGSA